MSNLSIPTTSPDDYYPQRIDTQLSFNSDLFQQLLQTENLHRAWRQVKANKGAAGIDGMTIDDFPHWVQQGGWQVRDIIKQKRKFAVDVDLSKFFDRVNHDLLMTQLGEQSTG